MKEHANGLDFNVPLGGYTSWRAGGHARQLYQPENVSSLSSFLKSLDKKEPLLWLGLGSNTLVRDKGFHGTVILTRGQLNQIELLDEQTIRVESGVSCATMARYCARNNFSGGEFWAGIPGTMGGALRMNAGCHGGETWDHVMAVETINRSGDIQTRQAKEFEVSYRQVILPADEWFVSATCRLPKGEKNQSLQLIKELLAHRSQTQPTSDYSCGSVFRNPPGHYAAALIESCGLKGFQLGGAQVSFKHANFIINQSGQASATDIESLILYVKCRVKEQTYVDLVPVVHIFGEES